MSDQDIPLQDGGVSADQFRAAYDDLREAAAELYMATVAETKAIEARKNAEADLLLSGKIDGKNDAQRAAQIRLLARAEYARERDTAILKREVALRYELATIRIKELRDLIRLMELANGVA